MPPSSDNSGPQSGKRGVGPAADAGSSFKREIIVFLLNRTEPSSSEPLMCGCVEISNVVYLIQVNKGKWEEGSLVLRIQMLFGITVAVFSVKLGKA